jgi:prepilin-type N-terminal cleavage/methylation domain-containing protein
MKTTATHSSINKQQSKAGYTLIELLIASSITTIVMGQMIFSLVTGQIYEVGIDEVRHLDENQVPLTKEFPSNCKKCYGRGVIGKRCQIKDKEATATKDLVYCIPCLRKCAVHKK